MDAVENAEVAEIKRAVFRALTRLRAATIKEFDTIARLETQAIDAYNDFLPTNRSLFQFFCRGFPPQLQPYANREWVGEAAAS